MEEPAAIVVTAARREDAAAIAAVHLIARRQAMPYLRLAHTGDATRDYFARVVGDRPLAWWVIRQPDQIAAYMRINGQSLDYLYVLPQWQGHGLGSALLDHAKARSPDRLLLWTFQRNLNARAFYEARGFHAIRQTEGENEEREPDVLYEWRGAG